jgi:protein SCO1
MQKPSLLRSPAALLALIACTASAGTPAEHEGHGADPHAAHHKMMAAPETRVDHVAYAVPDVTLVDSSGQSARLKDVVDGGEPVIVNFIFTTCTTICPVLTATTLQLQKQLKDDAVRPKFVSISIDPDYDDAGVLREYAGHYGADWTFLTGQSDDVLTTLNAFDAYRGSKVNHFALVLMRAANDSEWTRVEGLTSAAELARIWRQSVL